MNKRKNIRGITIISLVVTIIVLIIIAGVSIGAISQNNGLLKNSLIAKEETKKAQALEELRLKIINVQTEKEGNATLLDIVNEFKQDKENEYIIYLKPIASIKGDIPDVSNAEKIYILYKNFQFEIDKNLIVNVVNKIKNEEEKDDDEEIIQEIGEKTEFDYTGNYQEYKIKDTGYYQIECVGAKGGNSVGNGKTTAYGGNGGYTSGIIKLNRGEKLYIYVGGHGTDASVGKNSEGGYNGGGLGTWDCEDDESAGAGGGATDVRLISGEWNNFESLKSRIMVAAGGGGASWTTPGGAGGGLSGMTNRTKSLPGTQNSGYKFGAGQDGYGTGNSDGVAGSGGGYYGGTTSDYVDGGEAGAGGSSFISGYDGCNAISNESTEENIVHTGDKIHYSNKKFIYTYILDGNSYDSFDEKKGNGYAKVCFLGKEIEENGMMQKEEFNYTGSYQEYQVQKTGYYKIECIGASGGYSVGNGSIRAYGGNGGYTSGVIKLNKGEKLYIYVGGHGTDAKAKNDSTNGYNGGGLGTWDHSDDESAGAGGGATDIRLVAGEWNDFNSLKSRIMVAAGGGGAAWKTQGGAGGGLKGLSNRARALPGTQTSGYKFGIGQDGYGTGSSNGVAGSGGGYYGGTTSDYADDCEAGAGGSSFVSGYDGCDAISEDSTENNIKHTGQSIHYSKKEFLNIVMKNGNEQKNKRNDGYSSITYICDNYKLALILSE